MLLLEALEQHFAVGGVGLQTRRLHGPEQRVEVLLLEDRPLQRRPHLGRAMRMQHEVGGATRLER